MPHPRLLTAALLTAVTTSAAILGVSHTTAHADDHNQTQPATQATTVTMARTARALIPTGMDRLQPALRDGVDPAILERLIARQTRFFNQAPERTETVETDNTREGLRKFLTAIQSDLARPEQTQVLIWSATGAELAEYSPETFAFNFAGGAKTTAQQILDPDMTFYAAEYVEPGESSGIRFDLLYWDGQQWSFLVKPWRVLPD